MGIGVKNAVLIVAAGKGLRAGGGLPKQYRPIAGVPMLRRTVEAFETHPDIGRVQVVIAEDERPLYEETLAGLDLPEPVTGGDTRSQSVKNGLAALAKDSPERVLIHDAARPFVSAVIISNVLATLERDAGAFPALPVVDALWRGQGKAEHPEARDDLWRAQTPQGFHFDAIVTAYDEQAEAADDVAIARAAGVSVAIVPGEEENFKVTTAADFERAERQAAAAPDIRTGNGYDVHRFGEGDHVTLCGVDIPFSRALQGHSDADVGMHAITDAVFGALAEGDIGQWFPPSDPQWKGAASRVFLEKAVERCRETGFVITHLDCTLICELPKIGPHAETMREVIAGICGISVDRVSIKATTSERLGFTGRGEGIAAQATATLVRA